MEEPKVTSTETLSRANEALRRGSWQEARDLFQSSLAAEETPEALEGLGVAASWLDDADAAAEARERAYRLYRQRGDRLEASRVAMSLAMAHLEFLGEPAVASGWLRRARRVTKGLDPTPINGWIALGEGFIAVVYEKDVATGLRLSEEAVEVGRSLGDLHLEMMATGQAGLCMVQAGDVKEGMPLLDEAVAAAIGGELTDPSVITNTCCYMITACQRVRDHDRAAQWARKAMDYCRDWTNRATFSYCRSELAATLVWRGQWEEAERELREALADVGGSKPSISAMASARLADLRRRQGPSTKPVRCSMSWAPTPSAGRSDPRSSWAGRCWPWTAATTLVPPTWRSASYDGSRPGTPPRESMGSPPWRLPASAAAIRLRSPSR